MLSERQMIQLFLGVAYARTWRQNRPIDAFDGWS
jgi:hypothetical protein